MRGNTSANRPSLLRSFSRSQLAAAAATLLNWIVLFTLVELFGVWYVPAVAIGAFTGAITNFLINRYWTFAAAHHRWHSQALRYTIISASSLILNTGGVTLATELIGLHYSLSVLLIGGLVGIFFNFPLHRNYVFRHD